ncbi:hypothetical protein LCGC14_1984770 [marine sediment metagenome]|uniref:Methyltransferase domain-containing protein n=1 Tax=marine sediment metagenome TaxID=412755 RepID=A0A0F9I4X8_9ZZZZ
MVDENGKKRTWIGDFGIKYTIRNKIQPIKLIPFFKKMLKDIQVNKILEVGCNRGHNLEAISYCGQYELYGIDINLYSIIFARENKEINFAIGNIFDILYKDNYFDLILKI